jgi:glycosyltransferase 2 family protein
MLVRRFRPRYLLAVIVLLAAAVGFYGLLPQFGSFHDSWQVLTTASFWQVLAAALASLLACAWGAVVYRLLAYRRLAFTDTLIVQYAGLFVNRVLPAGIGGLGLNFMYLRGRRHTVLQAGTVVALNNALGFIAHVLLTFGILLTYAVFAGGSLHIQVSAFNLRVAAIAVIAVFLVGGIGLLMVGTKLRRGIRQSLRLLAQFYVRKPRHLVLAVVFAALLTLSNVASFWLSCRAVGVSISFIAAFLIFTFGVVLMTATPTPGGLGGAEAALVAGLLAQQVAAAPALAAVLLYRLVSFWLGLPVGAVALLPVQAKHLLRS